MFGKIKMTRETSRVNSWRITGLVRHI